MNEKEDRESAIYATGYWKGIEKAKEKNETLDTRSYLIGRYDGLRELTDDEIFKIAIENGAYQSKKSGNIYPDDMYILNFARAILKKASEK